MAMHDTRRVTISVALFVLLGLVIGTYASRSLFDTHGSGIKGATQDGATTQTVVREEGRGQALGGGRGGGSRGKDEYVTNDRSGGSICAFFDTNGAPGYAGRTSESVVGERGIAGRVGGGIGDSRGGTTEEGLGVEGEDRGGLGRGGEYAAKDEYATNERGDGTIQ
ncbi:glycine-rich protein 5-like [Cannabis sativa]|uniref:glycine-rich protein 5-like n=1 Tax=Cannabis sativa TaxID=3483 RepID=UPI0029CA5DC5|nr:glycine-rich protein 5-like [Cannabis sativa]